MPELRENDKSSMRATIYLLRDLYVRETTFWGGFFVYSKILIV